MTLPEKYKNLTIEQKRVVVCSLIKDFGDETIQGLGEKTGDAQIEFLFKYFFTESKEERERMREDIQNQYESAMKEIEHIAEEIQVITIKYKELLSTKYDNDDISNLDKKIYNL